jgi:hypothetical protein
MPVNIRLVGSGRDLEFVPDLNLLERERHEPEPLASRELQLMLDSGISVAFLRPLASREDALRADLSPASPVDLGPNQKSA